MKPGIMVKTFSRPTLGEMLDAVVAHGLDCVQFNYSCVGLPTIPDSIEPGLARRIADEHRKRSLLMAAISGTCNLIHPDISRRTFELTRLKSLIRSCADLGTGCVTLCTGTRDPADMWKAHPDNQADDAWHDLCRSLEALLPVAEGCGIRLGVEPEQGNVINSASRARRLLNEMKSPALKIIFDAANLIACDRIVEQGRILEEAADLLGPDITSAHAKDITPNEETAHVAAGNGCLDYHLFFSLLARAGYDGAVLLHSLSETEVPGAVAFLRRQLRQLPACTSARC